MSWQWVKTLAKTVAPIALLFVPPQFQAVAQTVYNAVKAAEVSGGAGADKLNLAMGILATSAPVIKAQIESITGRKVTNDEAMEQAISKLVEFFVLIEKCVGVKPQ